MAHDNWWKQEGKLPNNNPCDCHCGSSKVLVGISCELLQQLYRPHNLDIQQDRFVASRRQNWTIPNIFTNKSFCNRVSPFPPPSPYKIHQLPKPCATTVYNDHTEMVPITGVTNSTTYGTIA